MEDSNVQLAVLGDLCALNYQFKLERSSAHFLPVIFIVVGHNSYYIYIADSKIARFGLFLF